MALVEWAPGQDQFQGKYIGSAFGVSKTGVTLFRNPHAANNLHARQTERRWAWSLAQRSYKDIDPNWHPVLTECGQNNPHVNKRGEVKHPNRYHKYLQLGVFWLIVVGNLPEFVFADASTPYSVGVVNAEALLQINPQGTRVLLAVYFEFDDVYDPPDGILPLVYISRPVSPGVTTWHGSWYSTTMIQDLTGRYVCELFLDGLATTYNVDDRIIVQWHWMDYYRAFLGSVQQEFLTIQLLP